MPRLDIHSNDVRTHKLSNFYPHQFMMDEVQYASMEAFLQCLKFDVKLQPEMWEHCTTLSGFAAKKFGQRAPDWRKSQFLNYGGEGIRRSSEGYQYILDRAYTNLFCESDEFSKALASTKGYELEHTIGKRVRQQTVLTEEEFVTRLMSLRDRGGI